MDGHFAVAILAVVVVGRYAAKVAWQPVVDCSRCRGEGKHPRLIRRNRMMRCRRCKGAKIRIRVGRRAVNRVILARRKSNKVTNRMRAAR